MACKEIKVVQPVLFHADPDIHSDFVLELKRQSRTKRDALNEAMHLWTYLGNDEVVLARLKIATNQRV